MSFIYRKTLTNQTIFFAQNIKSRGEIWILGAPQFQMNLNVQNWGKKNGFEV